MGNIASPSSVETTTSGRNSSIGAGTIIKLKNKKRGKIVKEIATGGFSTVFLLKDEDGECYALKKILASTKEAELDALNELRAHSVLGNTCEYIIALLDNRVAKEGENQFLQFTLFFPFFHLGSLSNYLLNPKQQQQLSDVQIRTIAKCILSALCYAHSKNVAHLDLKPLNVMIQSSDLTHVVVIDWGSSYIGEDSLVVDCTNPKVANFHQERAEKCSSAPYRAVELWGPIPRQLDYEKCDVFSFGCLLYAFAFSKHLGFSPFEHPIQGFSPLAARAFFPSSSRLQLTSQAGCANYPKDALRNRNDKALQHVFQECLTIDPSKRPSAAELFALLTREVADEDDFETKF